MRKPLRQTKKLISVQLLNKIGFCVCSVIKLSLLATVPIMAVADDTTRFEKNIGNPKGLLFRGYKESDGALYYLAPDSIVNLANNRRVAAMVTFQTPQQNCDCGPYLSIFKEMVLSCKERKFQVLRSKILNGKMLTGDVIASVEKPGEPVNVTTDNGGALLSLLCDDNVNMDIALKAIERNHPLLQPLTLDIARLKNAPIAPLKQALPSSSQLPVVNANVAPQMRPPNPDPSPQPTAVPKSTAVGVPTAQPLESDLSKSHKNGKEQGNQALVTFRLYINQNDVLHYLAPKLEQKNENIRRWVLLTDLSRSELINRVGGTRFAPEEYYKSRLYVYEADCNAHTVRIAKRLFFSGNKLLGKLLFADTNQTTPVKIESGSIGNEHCNAIFDVKAKLDEVQNMYSKIEPIAIEKSKVTQYLSASAYGAKFYRDEVQGLINVAQQIYYELNGYPKGTMCEVASLTLKQMINGTFESMRTYDSSVERVSQHSKTDATNMLSELNSSYKTIYDNLNNWVETDSKITLNRCRGMKK